MMKRQTWGILFALAFALILGCACYAQEGIDHGLIVVVLAPAAIVSIGFLLFVTGITAWRVPSFRRFVLPVNLAWILVLMLAFAGYLFSRASFPAQLEAVKIYVAKADPALETYYTKNGHYPATLDQLKLPVPPPEGLGYRHITGSTEPGTRSRHGNEGYVLYFSNAEYDGDGSWFVDD